jgi:CheY-like chemotaxis protein
MNETLSLIISGISIAGSIGAVMFFKGKYEKLSQDLTNNKSTTSTENIISDSSKELELQVKKLKEELHIAQKQANDNLSQYASLQKQMETLHNDLSKTQQNVDGEQKLQQELKDLELKYQETIISLQTANQKVVVAENLVSTLKKKNAEQEINITNLNNIINEHKQIIETTSDKNNQPKSILMVDDSVVIRTKMNKLLTAEGYDVTLANDGVDALVKLPNKHFDLIITDLEMPNMNGFDFMIKANDNPETKSIPVIIITGHEDIDLKVSHSENLAGVFKKPWKEPELLQKIKFLSSLNRE